MTDNRKSWTSEVIFLTIQVRLSHSIDRVINWYKKLASSEPANERKISVNRQVRKAMSLEVSFYAK